MYAGVNSAAEIATSGATLDNDCSPDIPEWKKILIMKKRAGNSATVADEFTRRNLDSSAGSVNIASRNGGCSNTCDNLAAGGSNNKFGRSAKVVEPDFHETSPPKTVTIGNINVELRSVKLTPENQRSFSEISKSDRGSSGDFHSQEFNNGDCQDLQYGPGIVDRLRARFLNLGVKQQTKPVVRRFSSLENLPGSNAGPYRVNARGFRQNGFKSGAGNVKKAQSMETLICSTPEQQIFASSRRPNSRYVGGVKGRILKNISPISVLTDENDEPKEKSPSPAVSPRLFTKLIRRWDYNRSVSAPNINEDELPKPDTVKHVKKIFESPPPAVNCSEKPSSHSGGARFRKIPGTTTTSTSSCSNGAIIGSARPAVKKQDDEDCLDAKISAKELPELPNLNTPSLKKEELPLSPEREVAKCDDYKINKGGCSPVLGDNLSANRSHDTLLAQVNIPSSNGSHQDLIDISQLVDSFESEEETVTLESSPKVTPEQLPPVEGDKHSEVLSQGSPVSEVELLEEDDLPTGVSSTADEGMVVAGGESFPKKGGSTWQKAPPATTSVVFDFRGKDVKPNISLNPAPFGCRPAKVSRSSKRSGSPPRSGINGIDPKNYIVDEELRNGDDDEDWDEMDIGADLPVVSGIVFSGENVKVGRGALLEKRNKKLSIQFDDRATSTFEYPSENASPSPREETESWADSSFNPANAMGSASNSRLGLSNYTPQVLSSNNEFELGVSQSNHRPTSLPEKCQKADEVVALDFPTMGISFSFFEFHSKYSCLKNCSSNIADCSCIQKAFIFASCG
ncbi:uncharacterized protein TNCT_652421 [Trichonephila clavata]|uniref:Uncharacterized protein n=1 Tax=Trichonephila clavata TaxID=2740835 RepID=A0A8X6KSB7_TRICU|nr:uncharacterized protein TNCT_652421 [Trichonephila clavata]